MKKICLIVSVLSLVLNFSAFADAYKDATDPNITFHAIGAKLKSQLVIAGKKAVLTNGRDKCEAFVEVNGKRVSNLVVKAGVILRTGVQHKKGKQTLLEMLDSANPQGELLRVNCGKLPLAKAKAVLANYFETKEDVGTNEMNAAGWGSTAPKIEMVSAKTAKTLQAEQVKGAQKGENSDAGAGK